MNQLVKGLQTWAAGGPERASSSPLIAGYRRPAKPGWILLGLAVLATACFIYGFLFSGQAPARIMPFTIPIAALAGLLVWSLPHGAYAPTRALEPLYMAFLAALIIWPNYLAVALPGLPWMTMLRLIVLPLTAALLVCLSVSPGFRSKLLAVLNADKAILRLLLMFVTIQTASIVLSPDIGTSINRYVITQMNWTIIFIASLVVFTRRGFAEYWVISLLLLLSVLCGVGIWEQRLNLVPWAGHIPSIFKIDDPNVVRILAGASRAATKIYRVQATSTTPLGLAEILGLAVPFAIHIAMSKYPLVLRVASFAYIPLAVYVILATDSRLGLVAALGSFMIYLLIWALVRWRQHKENLVGPAIVLTYPGLAIATLAATFLVGRIRNEVWGDGSQQASNDSRMVQWAMGIPKILSHPQGHGVGMGGEALGFANGAGVATIDSYYLSILLEYGVVGFVVFYGLILRAAWMAAAAVVKHRVERELTMLIPLSVSLVNFVVVKSVLSQDANHPLIFMMLGGVVALLYRVQCDFPSVDQPSAASKTGARARTYDLGWVPLLVVITLASIATYGILLVSQ